MIHACYSQIRHDRKFRWEDHPDCDRILVHRKKFNVSRAIRCSFPGCNRTVVAIDHFYPYYDDGCRCKKHLKRAVVP